MSPYKQGSQYFWDETQPQKDHAGHAAVASNTSNFPDTPLRKLQKVSSTMTEI